MYHTIRDKNNENVYSKNYKYTHLVFYKFYIFNAFEINVSIIYFFFNPFPPSHVAEW